jgi:hypothetical protein
MIEANSVEGVEKGKGTLNFMGFDHSFENVSYCQRPALAREMVRNCKDCTNIV